MNVAVIGGGYAGMAAAVTLAAAGAPVTVFEAATELGGRARRVRSRNIVLDNGLHILLGAYRETLGLLRLIGEEPERTLLRLPLDWRIINGFRFRAAPLPAPLHLAVGLLTTRGAPWKERYAAFRFLRAMRKSRFRLATDTTVKELLATHDQGEVFARDLWTPLCEAALNTPPDIASAQTFLNVLRDALDTQRKASDVLLARVDLTALFPEPAAEFVRTHGGAVFTRQPVHGITVDGAGFVLHMGNQRGRYTHVICAVGPHQTHALLSEVAQLAPLDRLIGELRYQPIHTIYLQFEEHASLTAPMLGLRDGLGQWVFDRGAITGQCGLLAVVISAAGDHQRLSQSELAEEICAQLRREIGTLPPLLWHRVIAERRATFTCSAGVQRPPRRSGLENFFLAGDYTECDYPATLEAAVRSGVACAREVLLEKRPDRAS